MDGRRPVQLEDVIAVFDLAPAGGGDPPGGVLSGGDPCVRAEPPAEAVPGPHPVLVGGVGLQV